MEKQIWERGDWSVLYHSDNCGQYDCYGLDGPVISVQDPRGWTRVCFHSRRFWKRNRTMVECVALALAWVQERELEAIRAQQEAELAEQEAQALADVVAQLETP